MNPEAVAARTRYATYRLPQAVTAMPVEAMGQRRPSRETAIGQADHAVFSSQPVQVRAPVAWLGREPIPARVRIPASPMGPGASPAFHGGRRDQGCVRAAAPAPSPSPRTEAGGQHPAAATPAPPVAAPQRLERLPLEAARPAAAVRPERSEPRQPERTLGREESLRQQTWQERRADHGLHGMPERVPAAPGRVDPPVQRERPGGEHHPGGGRPNEKRGEPHHEQRPRSPGMQ